MSEKNIGAKSLNIDDWDLFILDVESKKYHTLINQFQN